MYSPELHGHQSKAKDSVTFSHGTMLIKMPQFKMNKFFPFISLEISDWKDGFLSLSWYFHCESYCQNPHFLSWYFLQARVTIQNYYQYRHVDKPGWKVGWSWTKNEVIWSMAGSFATAQGDCSSFKFQTPHSCKQNPVIADLMPDALPENKSEDCCRGGLLSAWAIDPSNSFSSFEMTVGNLETNSTGYAPANLTLMAPGPGYTCGPVLETDPTVSSDIGGRRQVQVFSKYSMSNVD